MKAPLQDREVRAAETAPLEEEEKGKKARALAEEQEEVLCRKRGREREFWSRRPLIEDYMR